jgi:hypothetical protein
VLIKLQPLQSKPLGLAITTVDTTKSPTTFIDTTANGVDLINIANPNSVGVSVNHYNKFNVGTQGAILDEFNAAC